jgi:hypothetical protein
MDGVLSMVLGFVLGFIASLFSWLLIVKGIRPKIAISKKILLIPSVYKDGEMIPKIKIENLSRSDAFEFNLKGRMFLFGLVEEYPDMPTLFIVNVGNGAHPYLPGKQKGLAEKTSGRLFRLHMNKAIRKKMTQYVIHPEQDLEPSLHDFLSLNEYNYIEVSVFCSHGFSFTRGIRTQRYFCKDIEKGYFADHGVDIRSVPGAAYTQEEIDMDSEDAQD